MTSNRNSWKTPAYIFEPLNEFHRFTVDACAEAWNAQLPRYWTPEQDGLKQDWANERVWCNPPYGRGLILPWVEKALQSPSLVVMLLPVRTSTPWFHLLYAYRHRVVCTFLHKRVRFIPPVGIKATSPIEASLIAQFNAE